MTSACLVTSTPDFTPPKQTRPYLVPSSADPDTRRVQVIDDMSPSATQTIDFKATVVSEDQGQQVFFQMYVDYGTENAATHQPFLVQYPMIHPLSPGTLSDKTPRIAEASLPRTFVSPGCHLVTLMASHTFEFTGCPRCANDSSFLSWPVYHCNVNADGPPCDPVDFSKCIAQGGLVSCGDGDADAGTACEATP